MSCPALTVMRGAMGKKRNGHHVAPACSYRDYKGRRLKACRHCHSTR